MSKQAKHISLSTVYRETNVHGNKIGRDILWSVNTDIKELVAFFIL